MSFFLFSFCVTLSFIAGSLLLMRYGRRLGERHIARQGRDAMGGHTAIEGAMFALMGLILAFALSGALQRFDERRELILQEANAISTGYDRLDMLEPAARQVLKSKVKEYLSARLALYREPMKFSFVREATIYSPEHQERILSLKREIWTEASENCSPPFCAFILTPLNSMFEAARLRNGIAERHPPHIVYFLLFGLGLIGALIAGFSMATSKKASWLHMASYAVTLGLVLFIVTDIEFPRLGFIQVSTFDHFLRDIYDEMR